MARKDGASVQHHARSVRPKDGHESSRNTLVATSQSDQCITQVPFVHCLNAVRYQVPRNKRIPHTTRPHCFSIGDYGSAENERFSAGFRNFLTNQVAKVEHVRVAGRRISMRTRHAYNRLPEILVPEVYCTEHRPRGCSLRPVLTSRLSTHQTSRSSSNRIRATSISFYYTPTARLSPATSGCTHQPRRQGRAKTESHLCLQTGEKKRSKQETATKVRRSSCFSQSSCPDA
mmetsp:Transcript_6477/g.9268  ORF Transcript_6477/g.9268 Transcript_6477/m.9268 type:complete len:231 (-) Transcript_6477:19-711(-)